MDSALVSASAPDVNMTVVFTAGGSTSYTLSLDLLDDENALEDTETAILSFSNPDPASFLTTGPDAHLLIFDDDGLPK